jgi:hypothetical protein
MLKRTHFFNPASLLFLFISLAVIILYVIYFNTFKVNYPQHEDSQMAHFVLTWDGSTWAKRIDDWGGFTFGHRYYYARAVSLISAKLNHGELDLTGAISGGGGITMSILFLLVFMWLFRKGRLSVLYLLPVVFLLFNPILRDYIFWALTNQLYPPALLFTLLAIILVLGDGKVRLFLAVISALIAAGSFSSGLLAFPAVALVLFLRRKYTYLGIWMVVTFVTFALYFRNYNTPGWGVPYISAGDPNFSIFHKILYLLACTGGTVVFEPGEINVASIWEKRFIPSLLFGTLCWFTLSYGVAVSWLGGYVAGSGNGKRARLAGIIRNQYDWFEARPQVRLFFTSVTVLLAITLYLVVVGRTSTMNGSQIFEKRLKLYPVITEILAYCMAICLAQGKLKPVVFYSSLICSLCIWSYSYFALIHKTSIESNRFKTLIFNYVNNENAFLADYGTWGGPTQQNTRKYYDPVIKQGVLHLDYYNFMENAVEDTSLPDLKVIPEKNGNYSLVIPGNTSGSMAANSYFVILQNDKSKFLVNLTLGRNALGQFVKTREYYVGELSGHIDKSMFPEGNYRVGLLRAGNPPVYKFQNDSLSIVWAKNEAW